MFEQEVKRNVSSYCPVSARAPIVLRAIKKKKEKKQRIMDAVDVFACIDSKFRAFNVPSEKSKATPVFLCDQPYNGICPCFARPLNDRDQMFGTQAQVVQLAREHSQNLQSDGYTLWVPFRAKGQYLAAGIYFQNGDTMPLVRFQEIYYRDELRLPTGLNSIAIFRPDLVLPVR